MDRYVKAAIWTAAVLAVAAAVGWFFFDPDVVMDQSMAPTMWAGDRILVLKRGRVDRGDVVVCDHPEFPGQTIMGRVVGLPGDAIEIFRGQLSLNGNVVYEESEGPFLYMDRTSSTEAFEFRLRLKTHIFGGTFAYLLYDEKAGLSDVPKTVVESGYYLLADNRAGGLDSRAYGEVHESLCRGRAFFIYKAVKGLGDADNRRRTFTFVNYPIHTGE